MTKLPKIRTRFGEGIGVELFFQFPDISQNEKTFLSADEAASQTTLSVVSGSNFSANDYLVYGNTGDEMTTIVLVSSATSSTVVVSAGTTFARPRGTKLQVIPYNQIIPERSTDGSTYSALSAISIRPDSSETYLQRSTDSATDYYRYRFYNSTNVTYSQYSDPVIATGYADNTVGGIIKRSLDQIGEQIGDFITHEFLQESLWEARRELDQDPRVIRWSFRQKFDENIYSIIPGQYSMTIPTDLRDPESNKNILSIRIGKDNRPCEYQDKVRFNQNYLGVALTTLNGAVLDSDLTITLSDSGDFDESGSISIAAASVSTTVDSVAYTSNAESTGVISGVTGIVSGGHATGKNVWQGVSFGEPTAYTVDGDAGTIKFDVPFEDGLAGENAYMDYYSTLPAYNSDADSLDEPEYDMYVSFLKWKIKYKKSNGKLKPQEDGDFLEWERRKESLIRKEMTGQSVYLELDID